MAKKAATADEKRYLSKVAELGCIVCRNLGYGQSPAEIHHIRAVAGMGQRASNYQVIPLCPNHHRNGGYGIAIHAGRAEWEQRYGTEIELLHQVEQMIKK